MTKREVRERQRQLFPNDEMLPEICVKLRMALNGSADPWREEDVNAITRFLRDVISTWSFVSYDKFDHAVFSMITHVLQMAEKP